MTCLEIETLIATKWGIRQNIIVPNVSSGLGIHECDLLILSQSNYATEIEIKISKADLKKDLEKKHQHRSKKIKYLYFAIPEKLESCIELIPDHAGIIVIRQRTSTSIFGEEIKSYKYVDIIREAKRNEVSVKIEDKEVVQLMRLGCMRIWGLKQTVLSLSDDVKHLRKEKLALNEQKLEKQI